MPAHTTTQFLQAGCPSCRPTDSVKALKAINNADTSQKHFHEKCFEIGIIQPTASKNNAMHTRPQHNALSRNNFTKKSRSELFR